jgi:hypothetical protein
MKILRKSRGIPVILAIVAGTLVSAPAAAQQPADKPAAPKPVDKPATPAAPKAPAAKPADAKALYASGEKKFKANDYAGALADFEASNAAKAAPETQRYIALTHDNLQQYAEAVTAYEKFLADVPAKMKTEGEEAKKRVEAIKAMPGKVHVETTPPGAAITVDGQASQSPTPTDLDLPAGKHKIALTSEGYEPTEKEVDVAYASKQDLRVDLVKKEAPPPPPPPPVVADQPPPPPAPPPAPPPEPRSKVPAYVTGAVAIVAAGVGTGFGLKALSQSNDFKDNPTTKRADDGENNALVADMMFGIAITFGVTSAVLFLSSDEPKSAKANAPAKNASPPKKKKVSVIPAPYVSPTGGGIGTVIRF